MKTNLKYGDQVRLVRIPPAVDSEKGKFPETYQLIVQAVGKIFSVQGTNEYGMAELWIGEFGGNSESPCDDSVWIETEYLDEA